MKKKGIWGGGLIVVVILLVVFLQMGKSSITVVAEPVIKGKIVAYVEELSEAQLSYKADVFAVAVGLVTEVPVEVGQKVKAGDVLFVLDKDTIHLQIQDLKAQIEGSIAGYDQAKTAVKSSDLAQFQALLRSAKSALEDAKTAAASTKVLYEAGSLSKDTYDKALTTLASQEASTLTAVANLQSAKAGLTENEKTQFQSQFESLKARLSLLEKQLLNLSYTSPMEGIVLSKAVEVGSYLQPGQKLVEIGNTDVLYLTCDVLIEDMKGIDVGTPVILFNDQLGLSEIKGKVSKVAPIAFSKLSDLGIFQKRVSVEIALEQQNKALKAGYTLTARFILSEKPDALIVNQSAIFDNEGRPSVFSIEGGIAHIKKIETGIEEEQRIEVLKGLAEGEIIVVKPDAALKEGAKVKIEVQK